MFWVKIENRCCANEFEWKLKVHKGVHRTPWRGIYILIMDQWHVIYFVWKLKIVVARMDLSETWKQVTGYRHETNRWSADEFMWKLKILTRCSTDVLGEIVDVWIILDENTLYPVHFYTLGHSARPWALCIYIYACIYGIYIYTWRGHVRDREMFHPKWSSALQRVHLNPFI